MASGKIKISILLSVILPSLILPFSEIPAHAAPAVTPTEEIVYELEWWVAKDGTSTKRYHISYRGERTRERLRQFDVDKTVDGVPEFLDQILPNIEGTDLLMSKKRLAEGEYEWIFRAKQHRVDVDRELFLSWMPVFDDPLASVWDQNESTRYFRHSQPIQITQKISYRVPWDFTVEESRESRSWDDGAIQAEVMTAGLTVPDELQKSRPGWDLNGFTIQTSLRVPQRKRFDQKSVRKLWGDYRSWVFQRVQPRSWLNVGKIEKNTASVRNRGYARIGFGARSFETGQASNVGGDAYFSLGFERNFSKTLQWRILEGELSYSGRRDPEDEKGQPDYMTFSAYGVAVQSQLNVAIPFFGKNFGGQKVIYSTDLFAGPGLHAISFRDKVRNITYSALAPGFSAGARFALYNPTASLMMGIGGMAARFQYVKLMGQSEVGSSWSFSLEFLSK